MRYILLATIVLLQFYTLASSQETNRNIKEQFLAGINPQFEVAEYLFKDLNNDNCDEFIVVGKQGQIKIWSAKSQGTTFEETGNSWSLPFPKQTLLSLSSFSAEDKTLFLISLSPEGLTAYPINRQASIEPNGILINSQMRFSFKIDQPVFANFVQDINQDGRLDVIVPVTNYCEIWMNGGLTNNELATDKNTTQAFVKIGKFPIEMSHTRQTDLQNTKGKLSETFSIPNLSLKDINGDKCPDLVVSHRPIYDYYLLQKNGNIPEKPTVSVDLTLFQDTTPKSDGLQFGETLSINNEPQLIESDLNNDGIPDYIIFHRRKLWIFHGTDHGPQFTDPGSIIKLSDDVTLLLPVPLDEDDYPDLLMLKVQIPTISKILMGIFSEWDIKSECIGYKSINGSSFELSSTWKGEIFLRLPSILSMISNPDMFKEFNIEQKYGPSLYGDFNGDGFGDVAMSNVKNGNLEIWFGKDHDKTNTKQDGKNELASTIRKVLFSQTNNVWDFDRIVRSLNSLINDNIISITGGSDPDFHIDLFKDKKNYKAISVDFNHDKINELLFIYSNPTAQNLTKFELYTINGK
jgi:hypothetical protein